MHAFASGENDSVRLVRYPVIAALVWTLTVCGSSVLKVLHGRQQVVDDKAYREITDASGRRLALLDSAYLSRQVYEMAENRTVFERKRCEVIREETDVEDGRRHGRSVRHSRGTRGADAGIRPGSV